MPALIMVGKYDGAIGPGQMQALAARLPNALFDEFDQSAHFIYEEQPGKFLRDVERFLSSAGRVEGAKFRGYGGAPAVEN